MGEDVVLWRALGHRPPGFYVDVGAHHPVGSSVTKTFYNAGWRGINIEPITPLLELFVEDRPEDVNLAVGVSDVAGELTFYQVDNDLQRSTFDAHLAASYSAEGSTVAAHPVPVLRLDDILQEHQPERIDFLKIDAEGYEESVVRSIDLDRWRPHVLLAEVGSHATASWPDEIAKRGYTRALFDGINQFFVADEALDELGSALSYPACPLDNYERYDDLLTINELKRQLAEARSEIDLLRERQLATHSLRPRIGTVVESLKQSWSRG